jgi:hypothetical protein
MNVAGGTGAAIPARQQTNTSSFGDGMLLEYNIRGTSNYCVIAFFANTCSIHRKSRYLQIYSGND